MNSSDNQNIKNSGSIASKSVGEEKSPSRFSRRRFLQSSAVASPLLMSFKSPVAWGNTFSPEACSITTLMSGNASHPHNCLSGAKSPGYWHQVFSSNVGDTHYVVREALNNIGIPSTLLFNDFFPSGFMNWQTKRSEGWKYQLSTNSDNPSFEEVLPNGNTNKYDLILKFEQLKNPYQVGEVNLTKNEVPNWHKFIVAGYLNSVFHPAVISYIYYPEQVKQACNQAIMDCADMIMASLDNKDADWNNCFDYSQNPLINLRNTLNTWD